MKYSFWKRLGAVLLCGGLLFSNPSSALSYDGIIVEDYDEEDEENSEEYLFEDSDAFSDAFFDEDTLISVETETVEERMII